MSQRLRQSACRAASLCVAVLALVALLATPAYAADVSVSGGTLRYSAGSEANRVSFVLAPSSVRFVVTDGNAAVNAGAGCTAVTARRATCPTAGVTAIDIGVRDGSDRVSIAPTISTAAAIQGGEGNDVLVGGSGGDSLAGGAGADNLDGRAGHDVENGGDGPDTFVQGPVANGADTLSGGGGNDRANYRARTAGLRITLDDTADDGDTGAVEGDNVRSDVERVTGGRGPDTLVGSTARNSLDSGEGDDFLDGRAGPDELNGAAGADSVGSRDLSDDAVNCGPDSDMVRGDPGDRFAGNCEVTRVSAPIRVRRVSSRLRGGVVRLQVACQVTAFGPCIGRVVVRTLRRVPTRLGRRRVRIGSTALQLDPGTSTQVRVRARRPARRLVRRHSRLVRASVRGGDLAGPAQGAHTVFVLRR